MSHQVTITDATQVTLEAIERTKRELAFHRLNSTKAEQLECFIRLTNLYLSLNTGSMIEEAA